jgi:hypothetical protein
MSRQSNKGVADYVIMDYNHYQVHDGQLYSTSHYNTIASGANLDIMIVTSTKEQHAVLQVATSGQSLFTLYEGITTSANGTTIPAYNMDRESTNTCTSAFFYNTTWSTASEKIIFQQLLPGGATQQTRVGAQAHAGSEWILNTNTKYLCRFANQAGATNTVTWNNEFYEES